MNENNKDAIIDSLKRRIKKLEGENKELREQLKFAYADVQQAWSNRKLLFVLLTIIQI